MTRYESGQDVRVEFQGIEHQAEILWQSRGWCVCVIVPDPAVDYGSITPRMDPSRTTVCVPEARVRPLA